MAGGDGKAPVFEIVRAGIAFARSNFALYLPAAALVSAINAVGGSLASIKGIPDAAAALVLTISFLANLSFTTFLLRLAVRGERDGFLGLKLGAEEGRLLLVSIATAAFGALIGVIGLFVVSSAVSIAARQSGVDLQAIAQDQEALAKVVAAQFSGQNGVVLWAIVALFIVGIAWIAARLAVAPAATVGERRMLILTTFPWTRGNAFRILAALAPFQVLSGALLLSSLAVQGAAPVVFLLDLVLNFAQLAFITPAMLGATAYLYKGFRPLDFR